MESYEAPQTLEHQIFWSLEWERLTYKVGYLVHDADWVEAEFNKVPFAFAVLAYFQIVTEKFFPILRLRVCLTQSEWVCGFDVIVY